MARRRWIVSDVMNESEQLPCASHDHLKNWASSSLSITTRTRAGDITNILTPSSRPGSANPTSARPAQHQQAELGPRKHSHQKPATNVLGSIPGLREAAPVCVDGSKATPRRRAPKASRIVTADGSQFVGDAAVAPAKRTSQYVTGGNTTGSYRSHRARAAR